MGTIVRATDIALIAVMLAAAGFTYKTKHDAENQLAEMRRVEEQIRLENDMIDVLKADWSLLTQPSRLQKLAEQYKPELELEQLEPTQIGGISELPPRPLDIDDVLREAATVGEGADQLTTGGIQP